MKRLIVLLTILTLANLSFAAEKSAPSEAAIMQEILIKKFIKDYKTLVKERYDLYGDPKIFASKLEEADRQYFEQLYASSRSSQSKVSKKFINNEYHIIVGGVTIITSPQDTIFNQIRINKKIFKLEDNEDYITLNRRLELFLSKEILPSPKQTLLESLIISNAYGTTPNFGSLVQVNASEVIYLANGRISLMMMKDGQNQYNSLLEVVDNDLNELINNCQVDLNEMKRFAFSRDESKSINFILDPESSTLLETLRDNKRGITEAKVIHAILSQYATQSSHREKNPSNFQCKDFFNTSKLMMTGEILRSITSREASVCDKSRQLTACLQEVDANQISVTDKASRGEVKAVDFTGGDYNKLIPKKYNATTK